MLVYKRQHDSMEKFIIQEAKKSGGFWFQCCSWAAEPPMGRSSNFPSHKVHCFQNTTSTFLPLYFPHCTTVHLFHPSRRVGVVILVIFHGLWQAWAHRHTQTYTDMHTCTQIHTCKTHRDMYICKTQIDTHKYTHVHRHIQIRTYARHKHMHTHKYTQINTWAHMHTDMHTHKTQIHTCIHRYTQICTYTDMRTCEQTCTYTAHLFLLNKWTKKVISHLWPGVTFDYSVIHTYTENILPITDQHLRDKNPPDISITRLLPSLAWSQVLKISYYWVTWFCQVEGLVDNSRELSLCGQSPWIDQDEKYCWCIHLVWSELPMPPPTIPNKGNSLCCFCRKLKFATYFGIHDFVWCLKYIYEDSAESRTHIQCAISSRNIVKTLRVEKWKWCKYWIDICVGTSGSSFHISVFLGTLHFSVDLGFLMYKVHVLMSTSQDQGEEWMGSDECNRSLTTGAPKWMCKCKKPSSVWIVRGQYKFIHLLIKTQEGTKSLLSV